MRGEENHQWGSESLAAPPLPSTGPLRRSNQQATKCFLMRIKYYRGLANTTLISAWVKRPPSLTWRIHLDGVLESRLYVLMASSRSPCTKRSSAGTQMPAERNVRALSHQLNSNPQKYHCIASKTTRKTWSQRRRCSRFCIQIVSKLRTNRCDSPSVETNASCPSR